MSLKCPLGGAENPPQKKVKFHFELVLTLVLCAEKVLDCRNGSAADLCDQADGQLPPDPRMCTSLPVFKAALLHCATPLCGQRRLSRLYILQRMG